jgi:hypothetical protein
MIDLDLDILTLLVLILAAYRVTRFFIEDYLFDKVRNWIWSKRDPSTTLGYLFTCYWCMGFWVSSAIVVGYILIPSVMFIVCLVLALSAAVGILSTLLDRN